MARRCINVQLNENINNINNLSTSTTLSTHGLNNTTTSILTQISNLTNPSTINVNTLTVSGNSTFHSNIIIIIKCYRIHNTI